MHRAQMSFARVMVLFVLLVAVFDIKAQSGVGTSGYSPKDPSSSPTLVAPVLSSSPVTLAANVSLPVTPATAAAAAVPAPAPPPQRDWSVLSGANSRLPRWIRFSGEFRGREEGRTSFGFKEGADDTYTLSRIRIGLDVTPTKWLHFFVQGQDSRVLGIDPSRVTSSIKNTFDLRQGYVELKPGEKNWVSLQVGRSELNLGNQRLVGGGDWGNVTRTFDLAKIGLGTGGNRLDIFAATPVIINTNRFDKFDGAAGHNLYGVYGTLSKLVPKATVEPYVLWKTLPSAKSELGAPGNVDVYTAGALWFGRLPAGFDYTVEMARQAGHYSRDDISAWAGYWIVGYAPSRLPLHPRFSTEYTYATGDSRHGDGKVGTFDTLYPATHGVFGITDLLSWRNLRHIRAGAEVKPTAKVGLNFDVHDFWLASRYDSLYGATGAVLVRTPSGGASNLNVGQETDFYVKYSPNSVMTIGTGVGHLFAGGFLRENSTASATTYPYAFCSFRL